LTFNIKCEGRQFARWRPSSILNAERTVRLQKAWYALSDRFVNSNRENEPNAGSKGRNQGVLENDRRLALLTFWASREVAGNTGGNHFHGTRHLPSSEGDATASFRDNW
jgi:hypothetical protein